jgi:DNA-binding MarR family transcriptional regulator
MPLRYTDADRHTYLEFLDQMGLKWVDLFAGDTEFYSAAYWDLLTFLWRTPDPVRKTDAQGAITGIKSPLTAAKYVETAIKRGLIIEKPNPTDARSKLLALSPALRAQLDGFFDDAVAAMCTTAEKIKS